METYYTERKADNIRFTHREFSGRAEFSSPNHSKLVISGKINLTPEVARRYAQAMDFDKRARDYFTSLVTMAHAKTSEDFSKSYKLVKDLRLGEGIYEISEDQHLILSDWFYFAIRELLCLTDFQPTGLWIAERLGNRITMAQAEIAFRELVKVGLIKKENGRWVQATTHIKTTDEIPSGALRNYHKKILEQSVNAIESVPVHEREYLASSIAVTEDMIPELKLKIKAFHDQILIWAENQLRDTPAELVYQMNSQLFPMTVSGKKKKSESA